MVVKSNLMFTNYFKVNRCKLVMMMHCVNYFYLGTGLERWLIEEGLICMAWIPMAPEGGIIPKRAIEVTVDMGCGEMEVLL